MERLIVEGREVDIIQESVNLNFQINDLGDISTRNSSFSNSINIPRTARNEQIFGMLGVMGSNSRTPYKQLRCHYLQENLAVVKDGFLQVRDTTDEYLRCNITDGIVDLADKIKGKDLTDLSYTDLNHTLTPTTFMNSLDNTSGFIYALADYGKGIASTVKMESIAPAIFIHTLFDKILTDAGFTYSGEFFNSEVFRSEVITVGKGYPINDTASTPTFLASRDTNQISKNQVSESYISYSEQHTFSVTGSDANTTTTGNSIIINNDMRLSIDISTSYNSYDTFLRLAVLKNGSQIANISLPDSQSSQGTSMTLQAIANDEFTFEIRASSVLDYEEEDDGFTFYSLNFSSQSSITLNKITGGQNIYPRILVGEKIKQIDLIKDVMNRHGLIPRVNRNNKKHLEFIQLENQLNDRANAVDYTDKLVSINGNDYQTDYAKKNTAAYVYDKDVDPTHDGTISIDNQNVDADKPLFKSPFQISPAQGSYYSAPIWEYDKDDVLQYKEITNRIFRLGKNSGTTNFKLFDDATTQSATDVPILTLDNIEMQYFLNVNYQAFGNLMNSYKEVSCTMNLTTIDLLKLDFFKLAYLKQTQSFYYLQKVTNKGKVKMLEIKDFSVNRPVSQLGTYSFQMSYGSTRAVTLNQLMNFGTPRYFDPENDTPKKIKITSFGTSEVKIKQAGTTINATVEIDVAELDLTIVDDGTDTNEHFASFSYQIMDTGSESYGSATGSIVPTVKEYTNFPPVARAGDDQSIGLDGNEPYDSRSVYLNGSASYDNTGSIVSYLWTIQSKPSVSNAYITPQNTETPNASLILPNEPASSGTYSMQLTCTDSFGATDTETMEVSVTYTNKPLDIS